MQNFESTSLCVDKYIVEERVPNINDWSGGTLAVPHITRQTNVSLSRTFNS